MSRARTELNKYLYAQAREVMQEASEVKARERRNAGGGAWFWLCSSCLPGVVCCVFRVVPFMASRTQALKVRHRIAQLRMV